MEFRFRYPNRLRFHENLIRNRTKKHLLLTVQLDYINLAHLQGGTWILSPALGPVHKSDMILTLSDSRTHFDRSLARPTRLKK